MAFDNDSHVQSPWPSYHLDPKLISEFRRIRQGSHLSPKVSGRLIVALGCLMLIMPVVAVDDELAFVPTHRTRRPGVTRTPIFTICFLIGGYLVTFSSNTLGPLMGITSVLWLMMRNDLAISPKIAWMYVHEYRTVQN